jgi:hypothetical protein
MKTNHAWRQRRARQNTSATGIENLITETDGTTMNSFKSPICRSRFIQCWGGISIVAFIAYFCAMAKGEDLPALSIQLLTTNQMQLTITNGFSTNNYEIYRRPLFDPLYPWTLHLSGTNGQTNFTASMGLEPVGFFQARLGTDSDGDGVPNWKDADPNNPAIGELTIFIDAPVNGANFQ